MVRMLATSRGLCGHCSWRWGIVSPRSSSEPEAASWELVPLACTCGDLREAYDRSYSSCSPSARGLHTEVDIQGRHERGTMRSFGLPTT
jgi:hypothetical protein